MARFSSDPFPGTDYTKYLEWKKIVLPSGEVLYELPNNPGYVFDPVASNASGRKVFRANPKGQIDEQAEAKAAQDRLIKQQEFNQSPAGQAIPVALGVGGLVAANQLIPAKATAAEQLAEIALQNQLGGAATQGVTSTAPAAFAETAAGATTPVLPGAEVAATEAAPGLFSGFAPMASSLQGLGALGGIAAGTYLGGKAGYDMLQGKKPGLPGRIVLGMATGGLSELAAPFLGHKSTRDRQSEVTQRLMDEAGDDANAQQYVTGMREQFNSAPPDPSKPYFGGKYGSFDEYQQAGLNAADLSGVQGNMDAYGTKQWANLTQAEREKATQALINANLYQSKDGGVQVKDKTAAKKVIDDALGLNIQPKGAAPITVPPSVIDEAAKHAIKGPRWIIRDGKTVRVQ